MSLKAAVYANETRDIFGISSSAQLVRLSLAIRNNTEDKSFPKIETIAKNTGLSERTVRRAIKELEDKGVMRTMRRQGKSSVYTMPTGHHDRGFDTVTGDPGHHDRSYYTRKENEIESSEPKSARGVKTRQRPESASAVLAKHSQAPDYGTEFDGVYRAKKFWEERVRKIYPDAARVGERKETLSQLKGILAELGTDNVAKLGEVIDKWSDFTYFVKVKAGKGFPPEIPNIGFLRKNVEQVEAWLKSAAKVQHVPVINEPGTGVPKREKYTPATKEQALDLLNRL